MSPSSGSPSSGSPSSVSPSSGSAAEAEKANAGSTAEKSTLNASTAFAASFFESISVLINGQDVSNVGLYRGAALTCSSLLVIYALSLTPPFQRVKRVSDLLSSDFQNRRVLKGRLVSVDYSATRFKASKSRSPSSSSSSSSSSSLSPAESSPIVLRFVPQSPFERLPFLNTSAFFNLLHSGSQPVLVELRHGSHPPDGAAGQWLASFVSGLPRASVQLGSRRLGTVDPEAAQVAVADVWFRSPAFPWRRRDLLESMVQRGRAVPCASPVGT
eukprot:CAMPEP_0182487878 /NCGR_PEP_ID=MMETSP1319-20130603/48128_1 /TAXON_ID=172717 /ORGANISM="Bolidomonas pacifica, Strain RCC208" /LENGTH=271 /DNA_ID=CAMNT_0024690005 /DNA_START=20 /DNA_END=832 /DNA_ORIENTATION=-